MAQKAEKLYTKRTTLEQKKAILKEEARISALFSEIDEKKAAVVQGLIKDAAFMRISLEELKGELVENGFLDEMPQGKYTITRESPSSRAYCSLVQRYTTCIGKLAELLPKETASALSDGFEDFVESR